MVVKKSEYQKQFKACVVKKHRAAYLENLNIRLQRRDREFLHTPICWEELNEEEEKVSSDCSEEGQPETAKTQQKEPEAQYQSLAEILSDSREKADAIRKQKLQGLVRSTDASNQSTQKKSLNYFDVATKVNEEEEQASVKDSLNQKSEKTHLDDKVNSLNKFVDDENKKLNKKLALTYAVSKDHDEDISTANKELDVSTKKSAVNKRTKIYSRKRSKESGELKRRTPTSTSRSPARVQSAALSERDDKVAQAVGGLSPESVVPPLSYIPRVRRPDRQARIPRIKSTPVSPGPPEKERPPFIAYGIGDKEDNLATHRTHNVRAPVDVYPPALRAKTRREEELRRQKEKIQRARSAEILTDKLSAALHQDPRDWESEYRKQFHGYEPKDYEKAIASHAVIPRSSQVRAVHRGGGILVHVD